MWLVYISVWIVPVFLVVGHPGCGCHDSIRRYGNSDWYPASTGGRSSRILLISHTTTRHYNTTETKVFFANLPELWRHRQRLISNRIWYVPPRASSSQSQFIFLTHAQVNRPMCIIIAICGLVAVVVGLVSLVETGKLLRMPKAVWEPEVRNLV